MMRPSLNMRTKIVNVNIDGPTVFCIGYFGNSIKTAFPDLRQYMRAALNSSPFAVGIP